MSSPDAYRGESTVAMTDNLVAGDAVLPGAYPSDIYLNGQRVDNRVIEFRKDTPQAPGYFCLDAHDYLAYGIQVSDKPLPGGCYDIVAKIPGSQLEWDATVQRLDITVPQASMAPRARDAISPRVYDRGVNAAFVNYAFSGSHSQNTSVSGNSDYAFLSLNSGLNVGPWRLRNNSSLSKQSGDTANWKPISSWAETDIIPWRSRLQVGQSSTGNTVFNSIQFRGIQLSSFPEMLPDSQRGYAPVVRGVANTNARVDVRQNGYTVYSTTIPPGPFALSDIYPSNMSGDLHVTVTESDGTSHSFDVPFSSVPNMLREKVSEYQFTAGKYHDGTNGYAPSFIQGTLAYGSAYDLTPYGGVMIAEHYRAGVLGVGKNLGRLGAVSVDAAWADTALAAGDNKSGSSVRFLYSKSLNTLGTQFQIAGYRYSTSGYYDFADAVAERNTWHNGYYHTYYDDTDDENALSDTLWQGPRRKYYDSLHFNNKRQRVVLNINQRVANASLFANVTRQNYWNTSGYDLTVQTGFNTAINQINYSLFYQNTRSSYGYRDDSINAGVSIPFSIFSRNSKARVSFNGTHSRQAGSGFNSGVSGTLLDDNRMNYFVQTGHTDHSGTTHSASLGYQGAMGNLSAGYSYNRHTQHSSLNASGGAVFHGGGVTLSQPLQNTFVLVNAPNAKGIRLENQPGVAIDSSGYAVLPSAQAYRHNRVALRTSDIQQGLDIPLPVKDIVPTQGAIGKVTFETRQGHSLLITVRQTGGHTPQIGASIFNAAGLYVGVVGTRGEAYVSGVNSGERLTVINSDQSARSCTLLIPELPALEVRQGGGYQTLSLTCQQTDKER